MKHPGQASDRLAAQARAGELVPELDSAGRIRSRHRDHQSCHGPEREPPAGDQLLQGRWQVSSQLEPSHHPALTAPDHSRHLLGGTSLLFDELSYQPALFECREPRSQMTHPDFDERLASRQGQAVRSHQIASELGQGADAPMTIDHDELPRSARGHDDDRPLLPVRLQRRDQLALSGPIPWAQTLIGRLEEPQFELHHCIAHEPPSSRAKLAAIASTTERAGSRAPATIRSF